MSQWDRYRHAGAMRRMRWHITGVMDDRAVVGKGGSQSHCEHSGSGARPVVRSSRYRYRAVYGLDARFTVGGLAPVGGLLATLRHR